MPGKFSLWERTEFSTALNTNKSNLVCFSYSDKSPYYVLCYFPQFHIHQSAMLTSREDLTALSGGLTSRGLPNSKTFPSTNSTFYLSYLAVLADLGLLCALLHHQSQGVHCVQDLLEGQLDLQENKWGIQIWVEYSHIWTDIGDKRFSRHWIPNLVLS